MKINKTHLRNFEKEFSFMVLHCDFFSLIKYLMLFINKYLIKSNLKINKTHLRNFENCILHSKSKIFLFKKTENIFIIKIS